jgi:hypothetical protein
MFVVLLHHHFKLRLPLMLDEAIEYLNKRSIESSEFTYEVYFKLYNTNLFLIYFY